MSAVSIGVSESNLSHQVGAAILSGGVIPPPVEVRDLNGGTAFTVTFFREVDGGNASTSSFSYDYDNSNAQLA